jgi:hypothetical protein
MQSRGRALNSNSIKGRKDKGKLKVHRVGNYEISIAPTVADLMERIDWTKFTKPADFNVRLQTLTDKELLPFECGYVIAKAVVSVKNDGFGVLFPDPGFVYFPTCHENDSKTANKKYDVRCYSYDSKKSKPTWPFQVSRNTPSFQDKIQGGSYTLQSKNSQAGALSLELKTSQKRVHNLHRLEPKCILAATGEQELVKYDVDNFKYINYCPIKCTAKNQNIILKNQ